MGLRAKHTGYPDWPRSLSATNSSFCAGGLYKTVVSFYAAVMLQKEVAERDRKRESIPLGDGVTFTAAGARSEGSNCQ